MSFFRAFFSRPPAPLVVPQPSAPDYEANIAARWQG